MQREFGRMRDEQEPRHSELAGKEEPAMDAGGPNGTGGKLGALSTLEARRRKEAQEEAEISSVDAAEKLAA